MGQGLPIASGTAVALSTTESANQVQATYDYVGAGKLRLFAKGSDSTVRVNLFINGQQVCRRMQLPTSGTAGTLDTSASLVADIPTLGGRVELTFVATAATPTVDFLLSVITLAWGDLRSNFLLTGTGETKEDELPPIKGAPISESEVETGTHITRKTIESEQDIWLNIPELRAFVPEKK